MKTITIENHQEQSIGNDGAMTSMSSKTTLTHANPQQTAAVIRLILDDLIGTDPVVQLHEVSKLMEMLTGQVLMMRHDRYTVPQVGMPQPPMGYGYPGAMHHHQMSNGFPGPGLYGSHQPSAAPQPQQWPQQNGPMPTAQVRDEPIAIYGVSHDRDIIATALSRAGIVIPDRTDAKALSTHLLNGLDRGQIPGLLYRRGGETKPHTLTIQKGQLCYNDQPMGLSQEESTLPIWEVLVKRANAA